MFILLFRLCDMPRELIVPHILDNEKIVHTVARAPTMFVPAHESFVSRRGGGVRQGT